MSGLKSWPLRQIEASAQMDLASVGRLFAPENRTWGGRLDALVQAHPDRDLWNLGLRLDLHDPARIAGGRPA